MIEIRTNFGSKVVNDEEATNGCYNLDKDEVIIAARVYETSRVPDYAFMGLTELENVIIEDGVESIGRMAFKSAKNLKSIKFPSALKEVEADSFDGCSDCLIQSFPGCISGILKIAKEKKREAEEAEKKRLTEIAQQQEQQRLESERRAEEYKRKLLEQKKLEEQREREEEEQRRKEYDQARNPRNSDEELLHRAFGDDIDLADARISEADGEYSFDLYPAGYLFIKGRSLTVSIVFAPSDSRRRNKIKLSWTAETCDVYDFDKYYCEEVAGLVKSLESLGIPVKLTSYCNVGDDSDWFEISFKGETSVEKSKTEELLSGLRDTMNECHIEKYKGTCAKGYAGEWFPECFDEL